ncbi:uncharacterized protein J3R85_014577 [Psidium guajava]|nr:uncharacterized protein J3R85_014577 [Psidium guajava]
MPHPPKQANLHSTGCSPDKNVGESSVTCALSLTSVAFRANHAPLAALSFAY